MKKKKKKKEEEEEEEEKKVDDLMFCVYFILDTVAIPEMPRCSRSFTRADYSFIRCSDAHRPQLGRDWCNSQICFRFHHREKSRRHCCCCCRRQGIGIVKVALAFVLVRFKLTISESDWEIDWGG